MKKLSCFTLILMLSSHASAALRIVATVPDLADLARQIGGEEVRVESLAKGKEDIHSVPQRPSFVPKLNRADGVVLIGMEIEHTFLPALLEVAQNPNILRGRKGYIDCSQEVTPMDIPVTLSRAEGELHPLGNPHYNIDPRNGAKMAGAIAQGLSRLDPSHQALYEENARKFSQALELKLAQWRDLAESLKGVKAVSHHKDMVYFADFLGLEMVGTVEPKPGIAPTPAHLEELARRMKAENVRLLIREVQYSDQTARWLMEQTGAKIAVIATMGGAFPDSETYFGMMDHNIRAILEAVK